MRGLTLLCILLCHWVAALGNENGDIGVEDVRNADGEILVALSGDELPLAVETIGFPVNNADIELMGFAFPDEADIKVGTAFRDDTHLSVEACGDGKGIAHAVLPVTGEPTVVGVNLCPRPGLCETASRQQRQDEYEKQPFHGANIAKN